MEILVLGWQERSYRLVRLPISPQMELCYNDLQEATEWGACGIALLLMREITGFAVVERSRKGTGFDYWLGEEGVAPFQKKARLEVSGILSGERAIINQRIQQKLRQVQRTDSPLPTYIVIVEFRQPVAEVAEG